MLADLFRQADPAKLPPKIPFLKRDWKRTMDTYQKRIDKIGAELAAARRTHGDLLLRADEGNAADRRAADEAHLEIQRLERKLSDTQSAFEAAQRADIARQEKDREAALRQRERKIRHLQKKLIHEASVLDDQMTNLVKQAATVLELSTDLQREGWRSAHAIAFNLNRCLSSHAKQYRVPLGGDGHPFDSGPRPLVSFVPEMKSLLDETLARKRYQIDRAMADFEGTNNA